MHQHSFELLVFQYKIRYAEPTWMFVITGLSQVPEFGERDAWRHEKVLIYQVWSLKTIWDATHKKKIYFTV